ncbi:NAD-glutamate dehydrogenase [Haloglycomyces albus]|uniref:NAD-glutamate dehydrogenase n=1 Tax=Haloglycomyces albus TaxID=526067 RepID=UPI00046D2B2C|nr:NAD-glutamate dehydrogenase [Haloglycomyces albus]
MLSFIGDEEFPETVPDRDEILNEATEGAHDENLATLIRLYWGLVADDDLIGRSAEQIRDITVHHQDLASVRQPGECNIDFDCERTEGTSDADAATRIDVVCDDSPFLVDSLTGLFARHGLDIHVFVHPIVAVKRDSEGRLLEAPAQPGDGEAMNESWMHIEVQRVTDPDLQETLESDIRQVLRDVKAAVADWKPMRAKALEIAENLEKDGSDLPVPDKDVTDTIALMRWLAADRFTFLGFRQYRLEGSGSERVLAPVDGTGLGLNGLRSGTPKPLAKFTPGAREQISAKRLLVITKSNARSTVHSNSYMDYIGVKTFGPDGEPDGELRFLGLFTSAAYLSSVTELPVVSRKVDEVLSRSGVTLSSHSGKDLVTALETYPRDELFQARTDDLFDTAMGVLRLAGRRRLRLFMRRDAYDRFVSCLVYLPKDRFNTATRLKIQRILLERIGGAGVDFDVRMGDSALARLHFIIRLDRTKEIKDIDSESIQVELANATRSWDSDLAFQLDHQVGEGQARKLYGMYAEAFPPGYKADHSVLDAVKDIASLEVLHDEGDLELQLFRAKGDESDVHFKIYSAGQSISISHALPVMKNLGVEVSAEHPYEIKRDDMSLFLHDFSVTLPENMSAGVPEVRARFENAFRAAWTKETESDRFDELVLIAGLTWKQVVILRALSKYLRQAGLVYTQDFMADTFRDYPAITAALVRLFEARFAPGVGDDRPNAIARIEEVLSSELERVPSLDADRTLRAFQTLIQTMLRTSYYQRGEHGRPKENIAFKFDARSIDFLPLPRPVFEVFVYSPNFEGVHMRYGKVARGGLRWSDRREDFRTEILGLVKAQEVKNTVITPVGAKGGFVLKKTGFADRAAFQQEGVTRYRQFISALLDITDNRDADGTVIPAHDVVRHDEDDPYLVVAADKGTATFSDIANEVSASYDFWLGDAFASGGSVGYDHKKMGITARGAWESVKRHFRGIGKDTQTEDFTVVGIGDMGGDVFGNGMLLSEHIRLVAAFNHMHIFIDPDPDAATSFAERQRLFETPRTTWADYNPDLFSEGGGVWDRSAKSITITPQVREALGLDASVTELTPPQLIQAILRAPVDLLWNGGIGTYVKSSVETNAAAGDKANDNVRVDGKELRCTVVGEGGNLGLTQLGRIEYAQTGGRITTDFIDNSGGVDTSDHEVNIKILLRTAMLRGRIEPEARDELFMDMADTVANMVLGDNYQQNLALASATQQSARLLPVHVRLMKHLERVAGLDREIEGLPSDKQLKDRAARGQGLMEPEFAVLLSYVKIHAKREVNASNLPDEAWTDQVLYDYFPGPLQESYRDLMDKHPLRREIVTTAVVNECVNRCGTTFLYRIADETGAELVDIVRAYLIIRDAFGLPKLWRRIQDLDNRAAQSAQIAALLVLRRALDRGVRWLIQHRRAPLSVETARERLVPAIRSLLPNLNEYLVGSEADGFEEFKAQLVDKGIEPQLADEVSSPVYGFGLVDVADVSRHLGVDPTRTARVYYHIAAELGADAILNQISALPRRNRWQSLARGALRYDLYGALASLTAAIESELDGRTPADAVADWAKGLGSTMDRIRQGAAEAEHSDEKLAVLSVVLRQIRSLIETADN